MRGLACGHIRQRDQSWVFGIAHCFAQVLIGPNNSSDQDDDQMLQRYGCFHAVQKGYHQGIPKLFLVQNEPVFQTMM